ncbi:Multimodular transpeptidase-transglycosylase [hydrothermal vent metagenome]|uniref:Penicillin-binding protein 1A n=1 Tax=hydrothermal vent metagenome TaxID=652676 RepID=A0A3B0SXR8_9ZZZZ
MIWRFLGFLFTLGVILLVTGASVVGYMIWKVEQDLPDYEVLAKYEPPVMTRVHAANGQLLAEFARERRLFIPIEVIPDRMIQAILSAEDKNFYIHGGIDYTGLARAVLVNIQNRISGSRRLVGASTITQQVAKNFLLTSDQNITRKLKEAMLAMRIEDAFSKEKILELYLNQIYFGLGAYGIAAASLNYYGKSLHELSLGEFAYLAALPKAPTNYHPYRKTEAAIERRNWVMDRMIANGYVTEDEAKAAKAQGLNVNPRSFGAQIFAAEYFSEEVRRQVIGIYGEKRLYEGGLSVRTTLDPGLQKEAKRALVKGLVEFDRKKGWRGPVANIAEIVGGGGDWGAALAAMDSPNDIAPWRLAVVVEVKGKSVVAGLEPARLENGKIAAERQGANIPMKEISWARAAQSDGSLGPKVTSPAQVLAVGDVIYVSPDGEGGTWRLVQLPEVEGAIVALDPHTGRVLAMVGGFSFDRSEFNRAVQAKRQPGSSFKPFVYAAALDNGYTPATVVMDAPIALDQGSGQEIWRPQNYGRKFYGPSTLRLGIEKSRNVMTVRLAQDLGMDVVSEYARRFGIDDNLMPVLSMALGAGETTLLKLATAYAMLDNGGKRITPTLIDRMQDRFGRTVYRHDIRNCADCTAQAWTGQPEPVLADIREQIIDPDTAYQVTSLMEGVVQRGTATALKKLGRPVAGKTGTTNEERDAWFLGYTPDLVVGVFVGYDIPRPMGKGQTGGGLAAPIFGTFMKAALKDQPVIPFRVPPGINLVRVNSTTGMLAMPGEENVIIEAFKPGTMPPESPMDVIGAELDEAPLPALAAPRFGEAAPQTGGPLQPDVLLSAPDGDGLDDDTIGNLLAGTAAIPAPAGPATTGGAGGGLTTGSGGLY